MNYAETRTALQAKRAEIATIREQMRAIQAQIEPQEVRDFELSGWAGPVRLSQLFGD